MQVYNFSTSVVTYRKHTRTCTHISLSLSLSLSLNHASFLLPHNKIYTIRLQLAALHFNENANRKQAVTKRGEERYDVVFPKYKKGGYIVRKVVQDPTYGKLLYMFTTLL